MWCHAEKWGKMLAAFDVNLWFWDPMLQRSGPGKVSNKRDKRREWRMSRKRVCGRSHHSRKGAIKDRLPFIPCSPGHQLGAAGNEAQHSSTTSPWRWQTLTRGRNYGIWNRRDIIHPSPPYKVCQEFPPSLCLSILVFNGFVDHDKCAGIRNFTSGQKRKWSREVVVTG